MTNDLHESNLAAGCIKLASNDLGWLAQIYGRNGHRVDSSENRAE